MLTAESKREKKGAIVKPGPAQMTIRHTDVTPLSQGSFVLVSGEAEVKAGDPVVKESRGGGDGLGTLPHTIDEWIRYVPFQ